jgi:hypothetical protein
MSVTQPVENNNPLGTYLTMRSQSGLMFGIINIIGNFGTVFVDQAYWQSAIAAKPSATYRGYLLGGICWFSIPFTLATTMGLPVRESSIPIAQWSHATEAFLTSSTRDIQPISVIDSTPLPKAPGPLTARLISQWHERQAVTVDP